MADAGGEDAARAVLAATGIDPGRRPETLDLDEWRQLATAAAALEIRSGVASPPRPDRTRPPAVSPPEKIRNPVASPPPRRRTHP
jgi:hypothetical protein